MKAMESTSVNESLEQLQAQANALESTIRTHIDTLKEDLLALDAKWRVCIQSAGAASLAMSSEAFLREQKRMHADFAEFSHQLAALVARVK